MARTKSSNTAAIIGLVLLAIVAGVYIGTSVYNQPKGTPLPAPPKVDLNMDYDDTWGKLPTAVAKAKVTHILIAHKDGNVPNIKDRNRTPEQAKKLAEQVWAKFRVDFTPDNWRKLQAEYNEDTTPHNTYDIPGNLVPEFQEVGKTTDVGFARIAKSTYGYHIIRRES